LGDLSIDGKIILRWTLWKEGGNWIYLVQDRVQYAKNSGTSHSIRGMELLDQLNNYETLKKSWS
jgi:hypothetical protein